MSAQALPATPRKQRGFTLIEVMITVGIIAILAGVAIPAYSEYLRRGQLPEAHAFLSDYRVKMEQYFQDNRNYGTGGVCAQAGGVGPSWSNFNPGARHFTFACALTNGGQGFTITATGSGGRAIGHIYTINEQAGALSRWTVDYKGTTVNKNCWLVKGDEC